MGTLARSPQCVHRTDLPAAQAMVLMADPDGAIEQRGEALLADRITLNLAADVADHAAEPDAQDGEHAAGTVELVGVGIAPNHDGGPLGGTPIALSRHDAFARAQCDQLLDRGGRD